MVTRLAESFTKYDTLLFYSLFLDMVKRIPINPRKAASGTNVTTSGRMFIFTEAAAREERPSASVHINRDTIVQKQATIKSHAPAFRDASMDYSIYYLELKSLWISNLWWCVNLIFKLSFVTPNSFNSCLDYVYIFMLNSLAHP